MNLPSILPFTEQQLLESVQDGSTTVFNSSKFNEIGKTLPDWVQSRVVEYEMQFLPEEQATYFLQDEVLSCLRKNGDFEFLDRPQILDETTGVGAIAGSNAPMGAKIVPVGHSESMSKSESEKKLKDLNAKLWGKVVKEESTPQERSDFLSLLLEADDDTTDDDTGDLNQAVGDNQQQTPTQPATQQLQPSNEALLKIGLGQLPFIYNHIFKSFFALMKTRFDPASGECLQLVKAYHNLKNQIIQIQTGEIQDPKMLVVYQELREMHTLLDSSINTLSKNLDTNDVDENMSAADIHKKITTNIGMIVALLSIVAAPVANGYVTAVGGLETSVAVDSTTETGKEPAPPQTTPAPKIPPKTGLQPLKSKPTPSEQLLREEINLTNTDDFKNLDQAVVQFNQLFSQGIKGEMQQLLKQWSPQILGTWIRTRLEADLNQIGTLAITIPNTKIPQADIDQKVQQTMHTVHDMVEKKQIPGSPIGDYGVGLTKAFDAAGKRFEAYDKTLRAFVGNLDIEQLIQSGNWDQVKSEIEGSDPGFFNQHFDEVLKQLKQVPQAKPQEAEKPEEPKEKAKRAVQSIKDYVSQILKLQTTPEQDNFLVAVVGGLQNAGFNKKGNFRIAQINGKTTIDNIRKILSDTILSKGSLVECIQDWSALQMPNELILFKAKRFQFNDLMQIIKGQLKPKPPEEEEEAQVIGPLPEIIGQTSFRGVVNDHQIQWQANPGTKDLLEDLRAIKFIQLLVKLPQQTWEQLFFTDDFYNKKLLSTPLKAGEVGDDDVQSAENILGVEDEGKEDDVDTFKANLKRVVNEITVGQNAQKMLNITSFKNIIQRFDGRNFNDQTPDVQSTIGILTCQLILNYFSTFQQEYLRKGTGERRANIFATKLLTAANPNAATKEVSDLGRKVLLIFKYLSPNVIKQAKDNKMQDYATRIVSQNTDLRNAVGDVLKLMNGLITQ